MSKPALVGIGQLVDLDFASLAAPAAVHRVRFPASKWLAWRGDPDTGTLCIVSMLRRRGGTVSQRAADLHREFHNADITDLADVAWHPPVKGTLTPVGLCHAVRYRIPSGMVSDKTGSDWRHTFGESDPGVIRHDPRYKPWISRDASGAIYIVRRPGNDFRISDWLYG
jgi:hypothetical protein